MAPINSKRIFAIETLWYPKIDNPKTSIQPMLDIIFYQEFIKYAYFTFNTREELKFLLEKFVKSKYGILYIATHGYQAGLCFGDGNKDSISLKELSELLNGKLRNKAIHMGSCETLLTSEKNINDFKEKTQAKIISGYTKEVDWAQSTALDIIYFTELQNSKRSVKQFKEYFEEKYSQLIESSGFVIYI